MTVYTGRIELQEGNLQGMLPEDLPVTVPDNSRQGRRQDHPDEDEHQPRLVAQAGRWRVQLVEGRRRRCCLPLFPLLSFLLLPQRVRRHEQERAPREHERQARIPFRRARSAASAKEGQDRISDEGADGSGEGKDEERSSDESARVGGR